MSEPRVQVKPAPDYIRRFCTYNNLDLEDFLGFLRWLLTESSYCPTLKRLGEAFGVSDRTISTLKKEIRFLCP